MAVSGIPSITFSSVSPSNSNPSIFLRCYYRGNLKQSPPKRPKFVALSANHVTAEGVPMSDFFANQDASTYGKGEKWDAAQYAALLEGGEQVTSVLEEMIKLVSSCFFFQIFVIFSCLFFWIFWLVKLICVFSSFYLMYY